MPAIVLTGLVTLVGFGVTLVSAPSAGAGALPVKATHVIDLHAAYENALGRVSPGKIGGIVYARGRQPKAVPAPTSASPNATANASPCTEPDCPLVYNGGPVQHHPRVYLLLWGPTWQTDSGEQASAAYMQSFYQGLGVQPQDSWSTINSQYTDSTGSPSFSGSVFMGSFTDTSVPPTGTKPAQLAAEASAFATRNNLTTDLVDDQIVIATQSGTCPQGFYALSCSGGSGNYCAYHASASTNRGVTYTNLPYQLDGGTSCGVNIVSNGTNSIYDGFSINGGHEYAETVTDPYPDTGWIDTSDFGGGEIGDKCAWVYPGTSTSDIGLVTLSTGTFAMQPLFSNANLATGGQGCLLAANPDRVTVTNPGNQTSIVGAAVSLQITANSSSGATLAYSATGLPAGLSINSATGLITGTPTTLFTSSVTVNVFDTTRASGSISFSWATTTPKPNGNPYHPLIPTRICDTRTIGPIVPSNQCNSTGTQILSGGATKAIQVTGLGGVPASGVSAVMLNVTVTDTSAASFLTVFPHGITLPNASDLNWSGGDTIPNRVVVPVGADGKIDLYNSVGAADVIVDVAGWFTDASNAAATGSLFVPLTPTRICDTRTIGPIVPSNQCNSTGTQILSGGATKTIQVTGLGGVPASGVSAVVLNVTVTDTSAASFLTIFPHGMTLPNASDLNWSAGTTISNLVIATLPPVGSIDIYNSQGATDAIVDIEGYYVASP